MRHEKFVGWITVGNQRTEIYQISETDCKPFYIRATVYHGLPLGKALTKGSEQPAAVIPDGLANNYKNDMDFCSAKASKLVRQEQERIDRATLIVPLQKADIAATKGLRS